MKILLISWYFPPVNDVAALRTGALADFLQRCGHEVFVLTAARTSTDESLVVPLRPEQIIRTDWFNIDRMSVVRSSASISAALSTPLRVSATPKVRPFARLRAFATGLYTNIVHIPDRQVGWYPYAISAGRKLIRDHPIDLIYASGPSFVSFMVASSLSRRFDVPWIAEYRDGWSGDIYKPRAEWREFVDRSLENRTVRSAAGIVAVSEPWAEYFRSRFGKPTVAIYNGFDAEPEAMAVDAQSAAGAALSIVYFGQLYDGLRDPTALYQGIVQSDLTPRDVQVVYYGPAERHVRPLAENLGVSAHVLVRPRVGHAESLRIQHASDVLLLLQAPDDPRNVPAKLFEYFASGRPILGLGLDAGVPAELIRQRVAGLYVTDPDTIARQLVDWVAEKRHTGRIADVPESSRAGLSRAEQLKDLERFLAEQKAHSQIRRASANRIE